MADGGRDAATTEQGLCAKDERVRAGACVRCAPGTFNKKGDDPTEVDTRCESILCKDAERVVDHACVPCAAGTTSEPGTDAAGDDTQCNPVLCGAGEHVVANACVACTAGTNNAAGDVASGADTSCYRRVVAAGEAHTCALLDSGAVKCWGYNAYGQLGLGDANSRGDETGEMGDDLPAVDLGTGRTAVDLTAGYGHTCALLDNGAVKCWGDNFHGQLGLGDTDPRGDDAKEMGDDLPAVDLGTGRTALGFTARAGHMCALLDNGAVKCWGENQDGALGLGGTDTRGDEAGEMGDALPAVDLGTGRTAVGLSAGARATCALLDNGAVKCWGENARGRLGLGDINNRGDEAGEMGDALPAVDLGTGRTAIDLIVGHPYTCALLDNGEVKCWGDNRDGALGLGDINNRGDEAGEMGDALPAVDLGTGRTTLDLSGGETHACALLDNGEVKCWGGNWGGALGLGDIKHRGDEAGEMGDDLPAVDLGAGRTALDLVAMGAAHTCALLDKGALKCWGDNLWGQLGLGDAKNRGDEAGEMGVRLPAVNFGN
jgi:alpha-tubulin suppressor-like RCC1 family protein